MESTILHIDRIPSLECLISQLGTTLYKPGYYWELHVKHANCMLLASQIILSSATAIYT